MSSACLFQIMQNKGHLPAFEAFHRQFTPASLETIVVAVPPSARYTAVLDLGGTACSLPLLLTSQCSGSVEMTHVDGRHRLSEYGVFTRFLIFSPEPDLPSCEESPTVGKKTKTRKQNRKQSYEEGEIRLASRAVTYVKQKKRTKSINAEATVWQRHDRCIDHNSCR